MQPSTRPPKVLSPGVVIDRYEILEHIADGGMGSVWLARIQGVHGFKKQVALKTIAPARTDEVEATTMLLEEARISSKLSHANVAQLLDVGENQGVVYLVFEWVDGKSLEQICRSHETKQERMPLPLLLRAIADAAAGLHAAHELTDESGTSLHLVHRDVTPSNVLVSDKGFAKVIDFGIAKARDRYRIATRTGMVRGTPLYISPEQACKEAVDRRSDVWSLGAVMYRCIAGAPPFRDQRSFAGFLDDARIPPLPEGTPPEVEEACYKALRLEARERYATAQAMREGIERALYALKPGHTSIAPGSSVVSTEPLSREQAKALAHAKTQLEPAAARSVAPPPADSATQLSPGLPDRPSQTRFASERPAFLRGPRLIAVAVAACVLAAAVAALVALR
jgi:serine/threonine-protein kinase